MNYIFTNNKYFNKLLLLCVSGAPGLYTLLTIFCIKYNFSITALGGYVNDTSIETMLGFFTYVSISQYVIKEIPTLDASDKITFLNLLIKLVLKSCFAATVIAAFLIYFKLIQDGSGFLIYLFF